MCKYCEVKKRIKWKFENDLVGVNICATGDEHATIVQRDDKQFYIYVCGRFDDYSEPISYCPFCGRKLKE
jgi:hypothetical protein